MYSLAYTCLGEQGKTLNSTAFVWASCVEEACKVFWSQQAAYVPKSYTVTKLVVTTLTP